MKPETMSAIHLEHTLLVLGDLDLRPLIECLQGSFLDLLKAAPFLKQVKERKLLRRIAGIWNSSHQELLEAECNDDAWKVIEARGAAVPVTELLEGIKDFFGGLGLSVNGIPGSSPEVILKALQEGKLMNTGNPGPSDS